MKTDDIAIENTGETVHEELIELISTDDEVQKIDGIVVGELIAVHDNGEILVDHPFNPDTLPLSAISTTPLTAALRGISLALMFQNGDPRKPIVIGPMYEPEADASGTATLMQEIDDAEKPIEEVQIDGDRLTFEARDQIVLKCGKASITLTKAGKIIIRGKYLLSRSSGANRIKGGSVQIN